MPLFILTMPCRWCSRGHGFFCCTGEVCTQTVECLHGLSCKDPRKKATVTLLMDDSSDEEDEEEAQKKPKVVDLDATATSPARQLSDLTGLASSQKGLTQLTLSSYKFFTMKRHQITTINHADTRQKVHIGL